MTELLGEDGVLTDERRPGESWDLRSWTYTGPHGTRPMTPAERTWATGRVQQARRDAELARLRDAARQALGNNREFLALTTPAQGQVVAQVRALTRQVNALARMVVAGDLLDPEDAA